MAVTALPSVRARGIWLALGWGLVLLVIFLSLAPVRLELPVDQGDKFSHVLAYFVLMTWFGNLYGDQSRRAGFALGFVLLGVVLEFLQKWTGYRMFEVGDMAACVAGVAAGWALSPPRVPNYLLIAEKVIAVGTGRK